METFGRSAEIHNMVADYWCSDGDGVELYIEKDEGGFELECFSGIPASKIYIDEVDFNVFQYAPNKIEELDFREPFELQCIRIADYLCQKFCNSDFPTKHPTT